jgi:hypothetical protein
MDFEAEVTDPLKMFINLGQTMRPEGDNFNSETFKLEIISYYEKLRYAANRLGIAFDVDLPESMTSVVMERLLFNIKTDIDKKGIEIMIAESIRDNGVALDNTWRSKVHSLVLHIRNLINGAKDLKYQIRETILDKLNKFDAEVDRTRTRVEVITEVLVALCHGVSEGAKELEPAVRVAERIIGALMRLQGQPPILSLPSPDQFDLPPTDLLAPPSDGPPSA